MIDKMPPASVEVVKFCSLQLKVLHSFADYRNAITRIIIDDLQSLLNFMGIDALLPEKIDETSLFDFAQIDIINLRDAEKRPMPIKLDIFPQ
jgi:hypothetical protein